MFDYFTQALLRWFVQHGRKNLPWQHPRTPYFVWISEVMLQQTQVKTVIPYFNRFIHRFPDIHRLAAADEDEVLAHWSGLGYYSRARHLHQTAKLVVNKYDGHLPNELNQLMTLPGIGASTAAAIASLAFNQPTAILDGNVKRVLSRYFLVEGNPNLASVKNQLWTLATQCMPRENCSNYTQAIMDFGALCCTKHHPSCEVCPLQPSCKAYQYQLVNELPHKPAKKIRETKQTQWILLHHKKENFFLEKQPPHGIWGGLWCMPSISMDACPKAYLYQSLKLTVNTPIPLLQFKHSFTHFHLTIKTVAVEAPYLELTHRPPQQGQWFHIEQLQSIGIPKPLTKVLDCFLSL